MEGSGARTVKMALAPAMNAIACSVSEYSMRPAAKRMMELRVDMPREGVWVQNTSIRENRERIAWNKKITHVGRTMRAVAIVRRSSWIVTCWLPSSGVPLIATRAFTGNDSGGSGSL